jgi:hypothetical protein
MCETSESRESQRPSSGPRWRRAISDRERHPALQTAAGRHERHLGRPPTDHGAVADPHAPSSGNADGCVAPRADRGANLSATAAAAAAAPIDLLRPAFDEEEGWGCAGTQPPRFQPLPVRLRLLPPRRHRRPRLFRWERVHALHPDNAERAGMLSGCGNGTMLGIFSF